MGNKPKTAKELMLNSDSLDSKRVLDYEELRNLMINWAKYYKEERDAFNKRRLPKTAYFFQQRVYAIQDIFDISDKELEEDD